MNYGTTASTDFSNPTPNSRAEAKRQEIQGQFDRFLGLCLCLDRRRSGELERRSLAVLLKICRLDAGNAPRLLQRGSDTSLTVKIDPFVMALWRADFPSAALDLATFPSRPELRLAGVVSRPAPIDHPPRMRLFPFAWGFP